MAVAVLCCLLGAAILFRPDSTDDAAILPGATLLSLGLVLASMSARESWRKHRKTKATGNTAPMILPDRAATPERRRSQRVMLRLAVQLRFETPDQAHLATMAFTEWVSAYGGLFEAPVKIPVGQKITLVIPQSGKEVGCHVLQVQKLSGEFFATSFAFDQQSPQFWPSASCPLD